MNLNLLAGLFYGQCAEYCGNSHAYMSFRALAQTDEDFDKWVKRFQNAQNPNLAKPKPLILSPPTKKGSLVSFADPKLGSGANREYRSIRQYCPGQSPQLNQVHGKKLILTIMKSANTYLDHCSVSNAMR